MHCCPPTCPTGAGLRAGTVLDAYAAWDASPSCTRTCAAAYRGGSIHDERYLVGA